MTVNSAARDYTRPVCRSKPRARIGHLSKYIYYVNIIIQVKVGFAKKHALESTIF